MYILECMNLNKVLYRLQISNVNLYNNVLYPSPERLPVVNSTGARCVRKKKIIKKYYIILQGGELTCFHFFKSSC